MALTTITRISNQFAYGPVPVGQDFDRLRRDGFRSVIDLRTHKEIGEELTHAEIKRIAENHGLSYYHLSVGEPFPQAGQVEDVRTRLATMPPPFYGYPGERAGIIFVLHTLLEEHVEGRFAVNRMLELGLDIQDQKARDFIKQYVDQHMLRPY